MTQYKHLSRVSAMPAQTITVGSADASHPAQARDAMAALCFTMGFTVD